LKKEYQKIISFLPSATEILFELDLQDRLKGVTHTCTFPHEALTKSRIINPSFNAEILSSIEIDKKIKELSLNNKPIFVLDSQKIKEIQPDLIISQNMCEVCAPFDGEIQQISKILGYTPKNLILSPKNISEIFKSIVLIGQEIGNIDLALYKVKELNKRIDTIKDALKDFFNIHKITKPKIICLEWISPFYLAGHWVPEMVEIAGGINGIGKIGSPSEIISIDRIREFNPDKIIIMPCGFDIKRTSIESMILRNDKNWNLLKAAEMDEVYFVDANSYFSKPSTRIITGIEILVKILYPDLFKELGIPSECYEKFVK
jgi:iron complex transport system substrate-binding protein